MILNEKEYVEEPFLQQLETLGWKIIRHEKDDLYNPDKSLRGSFTEVILEDELRAALKRLNPWLEDDQLPEIIRELTVPSNISLLDANKEIHERILEKSSAENRKNEGRSESVKIIDFDDIKCEDISKRKNSYIAISQFKVTVPGTEKHIIPDIVLFINGLPMVVIECKSPSIADPQGEAFIQLMRYQNRRDEQNEGNTRLFYYNALIVSSCRQTATYSTITGEFEHFNQWKDPYPYSLSDIDQDGRNITSQQILIKGMLSHQNLLDIIQNFTIYQENDKGKLIKVIPRYQQFRAVHKLISRIKTGSTPYQRGGTVWHTQGSGKSLTMMFTVRKMYHDPELAAYKIVFITDRTNLEDQLRKTAKSVGYSLNVAKRIKFLKRLIATNTPDLVMGMIHKFQERKYAQFPELNKSEKILILIDEAHRTQYKLLGANLTKAMPNAVKVAFTGTPIDKTEDTFGGYIDCYSIKEGVLDGVTVEIIYEGRTQNSTINDPQAMNARFEDVFAAADEDQRKKILGRYTWKGYLEAEDTINDKAKDMLDHYVEHIFPNGFKAQVVTVSREAAHRYKKAFDRLLPIKLAEHQKHNPNKIDLELLAKIRVEAVMSGGENDEQHLKQYIDEDTHRKIEKSFKLPFDAHNKEEGIDGSVGILIVQSMLLTGFDAPIEQVMYLDNVIKEHNLLQAIARVNRKKKNKNCGFVIDYVGVAKHLREALKNYEDKDIDETLEVLKDSTRDIDELQFQQLQIKEFLSKLEISDLTQVDEIIDELVDEETRNDLLALFRTFSNAIDRVLPKVEALKYINDLKLLSFISQTAANRYRDSKMSLKDVSKKVRAIIEEYLVTFGVDPKIPPLPIFSDEFKERMGKAKSPRAKAEELSHGIKEYINTHNEEDPELYERISDKLLKLLEEYKNNWDVLAAELEKLLEEMRKGREGEETFGLDPKTEMPFLALLKREIFEGKDYSSLDTAELELLIDTCINIIQRVKTDTNVPDFWDNPSKQKQLRTFIASRLLEVFRAKAMPKRKELSQRLLELSYHIYGRVGK